MKLSYLLLPVLALAAPGVVALVACGVVTADDDDGPGLPQCDGAGGSVSFDELEPNDGTTQADVNGVGSDESDGNVVIRGTSSSCNNDGTNWTGDIDVFQVNFACQGDATFELKWGSTESPPADLDYNVLASDWSSTHYAAVGYSWDTASPEIETVKGVGGPMLIRIMCWDGVGEQDWTFSITWDGIVAGDDDDSAGDDDDSAGDDDTSGDDDDTSGDDDTGDDDSAGDDSAGDDDSSVGDDDSAGV